jgi:hypothetical protein
MFDDDVDNLEKASVEEDFIKLVEKVKIFARKWNYPDVVSWMDKEINGYKITDDVPEYRCVEVFTSVFGRSSFGSYERINIKDKNLKRKVNLLIPIEEFNNNDASRYYLSGIRLKLNDVKYEEMLKEQAIGLGFKDIQIYYTIRTETRDEIFNSIRENIKDWTIKLHENSYRKSFVFRILKISIGIVATAAAFVEVVDFVNINWPLIKSLLRL